MNQFDSTVIRSQESALATNKVLKNTYILLSMTLLFSALMAGLSMSVAVSPSFPMFSSLGAIALIWFVLPRTENSTAGIFVVFAIAGLLGFGLGPMLSQYMAVPGGGRLVGTALGGTGIVFLGLSGYALTSKRDFSFMGGFLFAGVIVVLIALVANIFLNMPILGLTISGAIIMLMSGLILFDTSRIINGGETNYIRATVGLYLSIYNIFVALLHILSFFSGDD
ncbi:Putative TEGT family carrier/transport protein [hydrothermal vent metagenome]|uniref:TEGT family carrier/transport protein n=1 Tax=hydrothermal vent metagenome TaxID=652676 RepID=A0A3B0YB39_9ZZZZ